MSVTTPTTGQKISDFSAGIVDANSYFIQARNGGTSKVSASQIGQFSNLNLLFNGEGGLNTTAKTIVGAINEVNRKGIGDIDDVNLSSPADGDALIYDSTTGKWVNNNLNDFIVTERIQTNSVTLEAGAAGSVRANFVKNGYRTLGIVGIQSFHAALAISEFSCGSETAVVYLKNTASVQISGSCTITILFVKNFEGE